jgi:hypothetical protein
MNININVEDIDKMNSRKLYELTATTDFCRHYYSLR